MKKVFIVILIVGALTGISIYAYQQYSKLVNIKYTFGKPVVNEFTMSSANLDVPITITNTSDFDITIKSIDIKVYINDNYASDVVNNTEQTLAKNGITTIMANIKFVPKDVIGQNLSISNIINLIGDKSKFVIKSVGNINVVLGSNLAQQQIPINQTSTLSQLMA